MKGSQEINWQSRWFSTGGRLTYRYRQRLDDFSISKIVNSLASNLELLKNNELLDLRGRSSGVHLIAGPAIENEALELLYIKGRLLPISELEQEEDFTIKVKTPFKSFITGSRILHGLSYEASHAELKTIPVNLIGFVAPLQLDFFRLSLAFYRPSRAGLLGVSPEVKEELLIDCSKEEFMLQLNADLKKKHEIPLFQGELFHWLVAALKELFAVNLYDSLSNYK